METIDGKGFFTLVINDKKKLVNKNLKSFCYVGSYLEKVVVDIIVNTDDYKNGGKEITEEYTFMAPEIPAEVRLFVNYTLKYSMKTPDDHQCNKPL